MIKIATSAIVCIIIASTLSTRAQGKFAGATLQKLIGTSFTDYQHIVGLETYAFHEGSIVSPLEDEQQFSVFIFQKGSARVIFFTVSEKDQKESQILDVIELKSVTPGLEVKTSVCREYKQSNVCIVALLKPSQAEYSTDVKQAWLFNRDKIRFEIVDPKNVDCLNEGQD